MSISKESAPYTPGLWSESDLWPSRDIPAVRAEIASRFVSFAKSIALRYATPAESSDDLVQVANVGLMNAISRYNADSGNPFLSFASPTIHGELKRHFRDRVSSVRLPRGVYERVGRMEAATRTLRGDLGREPTDSELARSACCSEREVDEAREAVEARHPTPLKRGSKDDGAGVFEEHFGSPDQGFSLAEDRMVASAALRKLSRNEREMIVLRYRDELSQSQIAARVGCSQMQVSRKLRQILDRLGELAQRPDEQPAVTGEGSQTEV